MPAQRRRKPDLLAWYSPLFVGRRLSAWSAERGFVHRSGGKKLDRAGKVGGLTKNIVRLDFGRSTGVTVRAEQDRLHPYLPRFKDVAEAVVSNENRLFGVDLQFGQGRLKQPGVGLAIAVVARDDDGREVVGKAGGPKLG